MTRVMCGRRRRTREPRRWNCITRRTSKTIISRSPSRGGPRGASHDIGGGHPIADNVSFWFYERGWSVIVVEPQADLVGFVRALAAAGHHGVRHIGRTSRRDRFPCRRPFARPLAPSQSRRPRGRKIRRRLSRRTHAGAARSRSSATATGWPRSISSRSMWRARRPMSLPAATGGATVPKFIVIEAIKPGSGEPAWRRMGAEPPRARLPLRPVRYAQPFLCRRRAPRNIRPLPSERAQWDKVRHMYEIGRAPENANHPDHALALELARGFWASLPYSIAISSLHLPRPCRQSAARRARFFRRHRHRGVSGRARPSPAATTAARSSMSDVAIDAGGPR